MTSKRRAWLTPDAPAPETMRGRCFTVPDDVSLVAAVTGALLPLTDEINWEKAGSMTEAEAAEIMSAAFDSFVSGDCAGGDCPPPTQPDSETPFVRKNPSTGHFEVYDGDSWEAPAGDDAIPSPTARTETTPDERKCSAAANAASVLKSVYLGMVDFYDSEVDPLLNAGEWALLLAGELSAALGAASYAFVGFSQLAWGFFTEALDTVTADYWTDEWTQKLTCILQSHSSDSGGVVTFDGVSIRNELVGFIVPVVDGFLPVRWQTWYMLEFLGIEGLNLAGATTGVTGDCVECDTWCHEFDFTIETYSWAAIQSFCGAFYSTGIGGNGFASRYATCPPSNHTELRIRRAMPFSVHVTRVEVDYVATATIELSVLAFADTAVVNGTGTRAVDLSWTGTNLRFDLYKANANNPAHITRVRLFGDGDDPFTGVPVCE